jgi:hypothetical protein
MIDASVARHGWATRHEDGECVDSGVARRGPPARRIVVAPLEGHVPLLTRGMARLRGADGGLTWCVYGRSMLDSKVVMGRSDSARIIPGSLAAQAGQHCMTLSDTADSKAEFRPPGKSAACTCG